MIGCAGPLVLAQPEWDIITSIDIIVVSEAIELKVFPRAPALKRGEAAVWDWRGVFQTKQQTRIIQYASETGFDNGLNSVHLYIFLSATQGTSESS